MGRPLMVADVVIVVALAIVLVAFARAWRHRNER